MKGTWKLLSNLALLIFLAGCASTGQNFDESKV